MAACRDSKFTLFCSEGTDLHVAKWKVLLLLLPTYDSASVVDGCGDVGGVVDVCVFDVDICVSLFGHMFSRYWLLKSILSSIQRGK
jgi:hypothetical protein